MQRKLLGIIIVGLDITGQLLIVYFSFIKYLRKKWEYNEAVHSYLWTSRKPMIHLGGMSCVIFSLSLVSP